MSVVARLQRLVERLLVLPGVVSLACQRGVRELLGLEEVGAAQLLGIEPARIGQKVHDSLEIEGRLRAPSAAIRAIRHGVGKDAFDDIVEIRDVVRTGRHDPGRPGEPQALGIGAEIETDARAQRSDAAVLVATGLEVGNLVAAVVRGQEVLAAGFDPLDRAIQLHGRRDDRPILGIDTELGAKAAADFGSNHAHLVLGEPEGARNLVAISVRALVRNPDGCPPSDRIRSGNECRVAPSEPDDSVLP